MKECIPLSSTIDVSRFVDGSRNHIEETFCHVETKSGTTGMRSSGFVKPVELIENNGGKLKECVLALCDCWVLPEEFKNWIKEACIFCSTLVDRIVTGYPKDDMPQLSYEDNMLDTSELFHLWVIETDYDIEAELPFSKAGLNVIVTKDKLEMYRTRKVRILNGAHTSMIPYAMLEGIETVKDCMENEKKMSNFITEILRAGYGIGLISAGKLITAIGGGLLAAGWLSKKSAEKNIEALSKEDNTNDYQD